MGPGKGPSRGPTPQSLDPAPLVEAGLDPESVEGWTYAQIEIMNAQGATVKVYRLLKTFDLNP